jgi:hypothetical protein
MGVVVSRQFEPCPRAGLSGTWGSPVAWSVLVGMRLLAGASAVSQFPQNATRGRASWHYSRNATESSIACTCALNRAKLPPL